MNGQRLQDPMLQSARPCNTWHNAAENHRGDHLHEAWTQVSIACLHSKTTTDQSCQTELCKQLGMAAEMQATAINHVEGGRTLPEKQAVVL